MRIAVLGAGVIGVTTAYYLAREGHIVNVFERHAGPALGASHANAGQLSAAYAAPFARPGAPLWGSGQLCRALLGRSSVVALRPDGTLAQWRWILAWLGQCNARRYAINRARMHRLAAYSLERLAALRADTGLRYEGRQQGLLQLFRSPAQLAACRAELPLLDQLGIRYRLLASDEIGEVEPALAASGVAAAKLAGALALPGDETGDCAMFTAALAAEAASLGVRFHYHTEVAGLQIARGKVTGVLLADALDGEPATDRPESRQPVIAGVSSADAVVVALGSHTPALFETRRGKRIAARQMPALPIYPVKGYSLTLPLAVADAAPVSTVLDEAYKVAITRFDARVRVTGMAHLVGHDARLPEGARLHLYRMIEDLFPGCAPDYRTAAEDGFWCGHRPMTPDGPPRIGPTGVGGLYVNAGHGTLGWTMACGSAALLTDLIAGRATALPAGDYRPGRDRMPR